MLSERRSRLARMPHFLDTSLADVVQTKAANSLARAFGMSTVADLLSHYPRRYVVRGELTSIASLEVGEHATIVAQVESVQSRPMQQRKGMLFEVVITDGVGRLSLTFFNDRYRVDKLKVGLRGIFAGKVGEFNHRKQLAHPDFEGVEWITADLYRGIIAPYAPV